jgi:hypothetical protein
MGMEKGAAMDMKKRRRIGLERAAAVLAVVAALATPTPARAQDDLAKAAQNPVAAMISLPFQNNTTFGYGPDDDIQNVLNIQPVWPLSVNKKWNLITRTIVPVIDQPDLPGVDGAFGLGDVNETLFFSPAAPGKVIWGGNGARFAHLYILDRPAVESANV